MRPAAEPAGLGAADEPAGGAALEGLAAASPEWEELGEAPPPAEGEAPPEAEGAASDEPPAPPEGAAPPPAPELTLASPALRHLVSLPGVMLMGDEYWMSPFVSETLMVLHVRGAGRLDSHGSGGEVDGPDEVLAVLGAKVLEGVGTGLATGDNRNEVRSLAVLPRQLGGLALDHGGLGSALGGGGKRRATGHGGHGTRSTSPSCRCCRAACCIAPSHLHSQARQP